jgi:hypothetical protein
MFYSKSIFKKLFFSLLIFRILFRFGTVVIHWKIQHISPKNKFKKSKCLFWKVKKLLSKRFYKTSFFPFFSLKNIFSFQFLELKKVDTKDVLKNKLKNQNQYFKELFFTITIFTFLAQCSCQKVLKNYF